MFSTTNYKRKRALIIGIDKYSPHSLYHCNKDAATLYDVLSQVGFDVQIERDCQYNQFLSAIERFTSTIVHSDLALFYFAGYGGHDGNRNYILLPGNDRYYSKYNLYGMDVYENDAQKLVNEISSRFNGTAIYIFDCYPYPYGVGGHRGNQSGHFSSQPPNTFIVFSSGSRTTLEANRSSKNGLLIENLLSFIINPEKDIEELMKLVAYSVSRTTNGRHALYRTSTLQNHVYLISKQTEDSLPTRPPSSSAEIKGKYFDTQTSETPRRVRWNIDQTDSVSPLGRSLDTAIPNLYSTGTQNLQSAYDASKADLQSREHTHHASFRNDSSTIDDRHQKHLSLAASVPIHNATKTSIVHDNRHIHIKGHHACQFHTDKPWLDCQYHDLAGTSIKRPHEVEDQMNDPPMVYGEDILDRIHGSMIGLALGDALGAHVEFRPREYLRQNKVEDLVGGGTWGLNKGQFTDDTSMALCLANSLVARRDFVPYDQLVRYRWWQAYGYMSSTGKCFDIGAATSDALRKFTIRQQQLADKYHIPMNDIDFLSDPNILSSFDPMCGEVGTAGNGALMRLAPVPLFFYKYPAQAVEYSGISGRITHNDQRVYDACRYYGALIVAAVRGENKGQLLDPKFYQKHIDWFDHKPLHPDIMHVAQGSYQKEHGYDDGIRGKGYIVSALEAALWAFWSDNGIFKNGVLAAVNLGDDADTTAAIYGQLAGAYYGYSSLPIPWPEEVYAKKFIRTLSKWIAYEGHNWQPKYISSSLPVPIKSDREPTIGSTYVTKRESSKDFGVRSYDMSAFGWTDHPDVKARQSDQYSFTNEYGRHDQRNSSALQRARSQPLTRVTLSPSNDRDLNMKRWTTANIRLKPVEALPDWTIEDVCRWVESLGEHLAVYADGFRRNKVNGFTLYLYTTKFSLERYGITNEKHQKQILEALQLLKQQYAERDA